ncbi:hypothetical protein [Streptomyces palmae]|uniref:Uncharacterized protein n=1 Tax=Streptomyces palmae TaxID=1701085 RepID=A0A4Z0GI77_9ACTN|nr:hypothetical protein [Streptomyces palmae]TGA95425.1 hypothetical protein E4099_25350 [Streptomyces palmae]
MPSVVPDEPAARLAERSWQRPCDQLVRLIRHRRALAPARAAGPCPVPDPHRDSPAAATLRKDIAQ